MKFLVGWKGAALGLALAVTAGAVPGMAMGWGPDELSPSDSTLAAETAQAFPVQMGFVHLTGQFEKVEEAWASRDTTAARAAYDKMTLCAHELVTTLEVLSGSRLSGRRAALVRWVASRNSIPPGLMLIADVFPEAESSTEPETTDDEGGSTLGRIAGTVRDVGGVLVAAAGVRAAWEALFK